MDIDECIALVEADCDDCFDPGMCQSEGVCAEHMIPRDVGGLWDDPTAIEDDVW